MEKREREKIYQFGISKGRDEDEFEICWDCCDDDDGACSRIWHS